MSMVQVKGLRELDAFLQAMPAKMEANVLRGALRAGAKPVLESARANAPVKTGTLREGLKITGRSRRGRVTASVKATGKHAYLARWLEYGTAAHSITAKKGGWLFFGKFAKSVQHPGIKPRPFMRPALDTRARDALLAVGEYIKKRLANKHGLETAGVEIE